MFHRSIAFVFLGAALVTGCRSEPDYRATLEQRVAAADAKFEDCMQNGPESDHFNGTTCEAKRFARFQAALVRTRAEFNYPLASQRDAYEFAKWLTIERREGDALLD